MLESAHTFSNPPQSIRDKVRLTHQLIENHLNKNVPLDEKKLIQNKNEITLPLREVRNSLKANRGEHIANADLLDLMRRVRCFGINLARLDIRQEADRHEKLLNELQPVILSYVISRLRGAGSVRVVVPVACDSTRRAPRWA